ncbi:hypothetical protein E4T38_06520 [Aureobasidium subglaciale]|nr:hypothetical protein E4T38_06520 [Aureobasidium subglaciale]KAI5218935.1 hypothetical protein E4T40_06639 [Aureobasidium subglaciale]KAI5222702.1 hypothetical protein E4T41_06460 [Aureobasidium subglaciale]KAI5260211.1 hypothetical protein E4T46_06172 [Aureobasidium subglaciale]
MGRAPSGACHRYGSDPRILIKAAKLYRAILPYITLQHSALTRPSLCKRNVTAETIYVDAEDPCKILCFLNWQHAEQPKEHSLLENAWRIPAGDELTYVTRALDYIRNERPDIAEVLEDDPELAPGKLIQAIKRSLLIQREGDAAMQIVRDEVGDLAAQDWSVRPEDCDRVKELLKIAKEKVFAKYATDDTRVKTEKMWPFS